MFQSISLYFMKRLGYSNTNICFIICPFSFGFKKQVIRKKKGQKAEREDVWISNFK